MQYPPSDYHICPCCGTEFEYDDNGAAYTELRDRWVRAGKPWWSTSSVRPNGWDPDAQLESLANTFPTVLSITTADGVFAEDLPIRMKPRRETAESPEFVRLVLGR